MRVSLLCLIAEISRGHNWRSGRPDPPAWDLVRGEYYGRRRRGRPALPAWALSPHEIGSADAPTAARGGRAIRFEFGLKEVGLTRCGFLFVFCCLGRLICFLWHCPLVIVDF